LIDADKFTEVDGVVSGHVRELEWFGTSALIYGVVSGHVGALKWFRTSAYVNTAVSGHVRY
jgi:hypothetical protein